MIDLDFRMLASMVSRMGGHDGRWRKVIASIVIALSGLVLVLLMAWLVQDGSR